VTASSIVLSFAIALSTAFFTGSLAIAIAVFPAGVGQDGFLVLCVQCDLPGGDFTWRMRSG